MATFDVTISMRRHTVSGTLAHRGELNAVRDYDPNTGSHHPRILLIHVTGIPSKYATVQISRRKFKRMMEEPHRDPLDVHEHLRNRQFRLRIGQMPVAARQELMNNKEIAMTWPQFRSLLGKRIIGDRNNPESDTYTTPVDDDL